MAQTRGTNLSRRSVIDLKGPKICSGLQKMVFFLIVQPAQPGKRISKRIQGPSVPNDCACKRFCLPRMQVRWSMKNNGGIEGNVIEYFLLANTDFVEFQVEESHRIVTEMHRETVRVNSCWEPASQHQKQGHILPQVLRFESRLR
jgi:hypothetical protein